VKYCAYIVALLAGTSWSCGPQGCQNVGGGTMARKPVAYRGDQTANLPYIETGKIFLRDQGCQGNLCGMWAGLRPFIHNPLNKTVKVKISCQYWLDGAKFKNPYPTKEAEVVGPSSRQFEGFDILFDTPKGLTLGLSARCTATFDGYPSSSSDSAK
jgi:hypothetical protein